MWSVNTVPKVRSASVGFGLCAAAFTIRMASVMVLLLLEDDRFPIEAEDLTVHVGDLAQRHVVLDRVYEDRHHVLTAAADLGELLEAPFHLGHVARGLEPAYALHLLALHAFIKTEELQGPLFHLVSEALEEVRAAHGIDGERSARFLRDDLLGPERDGHRLLGGQGQ